MEAAKVPATPHKSSERKSKYRPEIDGLRAFAVVAVIINHFNKDLLPSGYLGVDIFFVISGYVITSSLADRDSKNFLDFVTGFYERRIKRLVPALVVFVLITSVLISLFNPDPTTAELRTGITSLFGLSNIYLLRQQSDYFAQATTFNPFAHTWSLGVEEQFYLLFPFLIWFSGFGQQKAKGARNLFFWVGALTIASLIGFIYLYQVNQPAAYFLMPPRFWEMAAGCLIFIGFQKRARIEQALEQVPPLLVVAAMVGVMLLPKSAAVPATIGIVVLSAILIACLKKGTRAYRFFSLKKIVFIGLISYSLYLWHWSVLTISRWTIGIYWWSAPLQFLLIVLIAICSYKWIELPLREKQWSGNRRNSIGIGLIIVTATATLIKGYKAEYPWNFYMGSKMKESNERITEFAQVSGSCNLFENYGKVVRHIVDCGSIEFKGRPTIYLLGDSHAEQFGEFIAKYARHQRYNYIAIWGNGCLFPSAVLARSKEICFDRQRQIEQKILSLVGRDDVIFVGNALYDNFSEDQDKNFSTRDGKPLSVEVAAKIFSEVFRVFAGKVEARGGKTILYIDSLQFPSLERPGNSCRIEWFRPQWAIPDQCFQTIDAHLRSINRYFSWRGVWSNNETRIVLNAYEYRKCGEDGRCDATAYKDGGHFTRTYAAEVLRRFLDANRSIFSASRK